MKAWRIVWVVGIVAAVGGCKKEEAPRAEAPAEPVVGQAEEAHAPGEKKVALPKTPWKGAAIAHGGVGSPPEMSDGCRKAVDRALDVLEKTGDPLEAAVAGVVVLEDDPRYNAGTGAYVRLDGESVQMDAAVMDSDGRFGAVAVIEKVKNPVLVARAVRDTPHLLLAGDGATRFARTLGFEEHSTATPDQLARSRELLGKLRRVDPSLPASWKDFDWKKHWNFEKTLEKAGVPRAELGHDTVGVAVRAPDGRFGVALSTGGWTITLRGRVGDVPILGAGLYAGAHGAVAATGAGERIMEAGLARRVHRQLERGTPAEEAAAFGVEMLRGKGSIGLIVVGPETMAAAADRPMAWAARELGSSEWLGPEAAR